MYLQRPARYSERIKSLYDTLLIQVIDIDADDLFMFSLFLFVDYHRHFGVLSVSANPEDEFIRCSRYV